MPKDVEEVKFDVEEQINVTEADTQLYENINMNDEDFSMSQPRCESGRKCLQF